MCLRAMWRLCRQSRLQESLPEGGQAGPGSRNEKKTDEILRVDLLNVGVRQIILNRSVREREDLTTKDERKIAIRDYGPRLA